MFLSCEMPMSPRVKMLMTCEWHTLDSCSHAILDQTVQQPTWMLMFLRCPFAVKSDKDHVDAKSIWLKITKKL